MPIPNAHRRRFVAPVVLAVSLAIAAISIAAYWHFRSRRELAEALDREAKAPKQLEAIERELEQKAAELEAAERDLQRAQLELQNKLNEELRAREKARAGDADGQRIDAKVLAVKPEVNLVMLSVGTNNGVQSGYHFIVSRKNQIVGTVQVDKVWPDMCSARMVGSNNLEIQIEKGDTASTR